MLRFDESSAECLVLTFKEGLLSAMAHDLVIRVTSFALEVDEAERAVEGRFAAGSLRVLHALHDDVETPTSERDRQQIEESIRREVLDSDRHPEIRFRSSRVDEQSGRFALRGVLEIRGVTREIRATVEQVGGHWVGEALVHQPDFGIRPYTAFLGALKVKPDVRVRITVAATALREVR